MDGFYVYIVIPLVAIFLLRILIKLIRFIKNSVGCWHKQGDSIFTVVDEKNMEFQQSDLHCVILKGKLLSSIGSLFSRIFRKPKYEDAVCGPLGNGLIGALIAIVVFFAEVIFGPTKSKVAVETIVEKIFTK